MMSVDRLGGTFGADGGAENLELRGAVAEIACCVCVCVCVG